MVSCIYFVISLIDDALRVFFLFQAEDGIRDLVRSRGLGDVYKRQAPCCHRHGAHRAFPASGSGSPAPGDPGTGC